jgi:hypothetical protein
MPPLGTTQVKIRLEGRTTLNVLVFAAAGSIKLPISAASILEEQRPLERISK